MNTKITVVIPTYNKAAYISQTIESVLRQTYQDFEIIIIDDCSKDDTELVVQKYLSDKIHYFKHTRNWGPGATFNDGIEKSNTEYITLIASDDVLLPNHLEVIMSEFKKDISLYVVFPNTRIIDEKNIVIDEPSHIMSSCDDIYVALNRLFYEGNYISSPGISFKKELFKRIKPFNPNLIQTHDYDLNVRCLINSKVAFLNDITVLYRRFSTNLENLSGTTPWLYTCYDIEVGFVFDNYLCLSYEMMQRVFPHLSHYTEDEIKFRFLIDSCKNPKNEISSWAFKNLINFLDERPDFFNDNYYGFEYKDYINLYKTNIQISNKNFYRKELFHRMKVIVKKILGIK